jgi:hypothetical protein
VFCASLADVLDNQVPQQWRVDLAMLIEHAGTRLAAADQAPRTSPRCRRGVRTMDCPTNVWLGTTCEDQEHYDRRWAHPAQDPGDGALHQLRAAIGLLSHRRRTRGSAPDWIICGGESGHGARMMDPAWARASPNCAQAGVVLHEADDRQEADPGRPDGAAVSRERGRFGDNESNHSDKVIKSDLVDLDLYLMNDNPSKKAIAVSLALPAPFETWKWLPRSLIEYQHTGNDNRGAKLVRVTLPERAAKEKGLI